ETLQPKQTLLRGPVVRQPGPDLGIVQGKGREKDAGAVQEKVAAVNPELAEPEPHAMRDVQQLAPRLHQRKLEAVHVLRCMEIPDLLWLPLFREGDAALLEVACLERLASEFPDTASSV